MIKIPPLRTRRLTVTMEELSIGDSMGIAAMPTGRPQAECTAFLRAAIGTSPGVPDPAQWTVQERAHAVAWYMAATLDDGPDFSLGAGHYSDYLDGTADIKLPVCTAPAGELAGDTWHIRHLTGAMAESIERTEGEIPGQTGRAHWIFGTMAAQLIREGEDVPDGTGSEGAFDEFLVGRMQILKGFPASDFDALFGMFFDGREALHHLMRIEIGKEGLVVMPKEMKGGAASDLPPCTFPARTALPQLARDLVHQLDGDGQ